jgi:glycosyltransferase involved in cell wall biosynthesis
VTRNATPGALRGLPHALRVLYVVTAQSAFAQDPSRKISAIVRCWRELGHEVDLIRGGDTLPPGRRERVHRNHASRARPRWYRRQPLLGAAVESLSELLNLQHDRRLARLVSRRIQEFRPHLYWQRSSRLDGLTFAAGRGSGVPTVLEWKDHLLPYPVALLRPYAARVERRKEREADFVVVESGVLKERLAPLRRDGGASIFVAHNAIDPAEFAGAERLGRAEARQRTGLPLERFLAVYVGSFAWYHRVELLLEALVAVRRSGGASVGAVLVGDGPGRPAAERRARELGLQEWALFAGRIPPEQVPHWLAAADVAVLPDCTDIITPIKVQEYMAMGLPTLAPDYAPNREVIQHGQTGLLFAPRDARALAAQLQRLRGAPALRDAIGTAARHAARERFTWHSTWGEVLGCIAESVRNRRAQGDRGPEFEA